MIRYSDRSVFCCKHLFFFQLSWNRFESFLNERKLWCFGLNGSAAFLCLVGFRRFSRSHNLIDSVHLQYLQKHFLLSPCTLISQFLNLLSLSHSARKRCVFWFFPWRPNTCTRQESSIYCGRWASRRQGQYRNRIVTGLGRDSTVNKRTTVAREPILFIKYYCRVKC